MSRITNDVYRLMVDRNVESNVEEGSIISELARDIGVYHEEINLGLLLID